LTTTQILRATTPQIRAACDRIDDAIGGLIVAVGEAVWAYPARGRYETDKEAVTLLTIATRA